MGNRKRSALALPGAGDALEIIRQERFDSEVDRRLMLAKEPKTLPQRVEHAGGKCRFGAGLVDVRRRGQSGEGELKGQVRLQLLATIGVRREGFVPSNSTLQGVGFGQ